MPDKIESLYAYITEDEDGNEAVPGIVRMVAGEATALPLMGATRERMASLRDEAQKIANDLGQEIRLVGGEVVVIDIIAPE